MMFISKRKVKNMLLEIMNSANETRKKTANSVDEQVRRDAFMFASGCIHCVTVMLLKLEGEYNGESNGAASKE